MQIDTTGDPALEDEIKAFIHVRDDKPGNVFLGVVHRIDRPVSGAVLFAKTGKALTRMNELVKNREIRKIYWALTENRPQQPEGELVHHLARDGKTNKSRVYDRPTAGSKEARLRYRLLGSGTHYHLLEIELLTGRHHQIRAQLSKIGCPDSRRPEVRRRAFEPRRQHLVACAEYRIRPSGAQGTLTRYGPRTAAGQPVEVRRNARINWKIPEKFSGND